MYPARAPPLNLISPIFHQLIHVFNKTMPANMEYFTSNDGYRLAYQDIGPASLPPLILVRHLFHSRPNTPHHLTTPPSFTASRAHPTTGNTSSPSSHHPTISSPQTSAAMATPQNHFMASTSPALPWTCMISSYILDLRKRRQN
jgi:hypothetical protein